MLYNAGSSLSFIFVKCKLIKEGPDVKVAAVIVVSNEFTFSYPLECHVLPDGSTLMGRLLANIANSPVCGVVIVALGWQITELAARHGRTLEDGRPVNYLELEAPETDLATAVLRGCRTAENKYDVDSCVVVLPGQVYSKPSALGHFVLTADAPAVGTLDTYEWPGYEVWAEKTASNKVQAFGFNTQGPWNRRTVGPLLLDRHTVKRLRRIRKQQAPNFPVSHYAGLAFLLNLDLADNPYYAPRIVGSLETLTHWNALKRFQNELIKEYN